MSLLARRRRAGALLFLLASVAPMLVQLAATHSRTGQWSFIDSRRTAWAEKLHFDTTLEGYDTQGPARGIRHAAADCFQRSTSMLDAFHENDWRAVACLLARRQYFYFGSYVDWGRVYLSSPAERRFSVGYLVLNVLAVLLALALACSSARREALFVPFVLLGGIWGQGSVIIPESRFLMVGHVALWVLALWAVPEAVAWIGDRGAHGAGPRR